jgi:very-short-patch-repair endonuclease
MDKFRFNNKLLKERRKELRVNQTEAEGKLWEKLCNRKLNGFKFYRQYSIGGYIIDFYCPKIRIGIELDGNQHQEKGAKLYDKNRERELEAHNIRIVRFWNSEVENYIEKVLEKISQEINNSYT